MPTIPQLPEASSLTGAELLPLAQGGSAKRATVSELRKHAGPFFNIRHFGAPGAGNDYTDNFLAALEAASDGGTVFVPAGTHYTEQTLVLPQGVRLIGEGHWANGSIINAAPGFTGTLIDLEHFYSGEIESLWLRSYGHCIEAHETIVCAFRKLSLGPGNDSWGIATTEGNVFGLSLDTIRCWGNGSYRQKGIQLAGHAIATNLDIVGMEVGLMARGGVTVTSGRFETNVLALDVSNNGDTSWGSEISGLTFESNMIAMRLRASKTTLTNIAITAYEGQGPVGYTEDRMCLHGIVMDSFTESRMKTITIAGFWPNRPAVKVGVVYGSAFDGVWAHNAGPGELAWDRPIQVLNAAGNSVVGSQIPLHPGDDLLYDTIHKAVRTASLQGVNYLRPAVQGKTIGDLEVAVTESETSVDIVFQAGGQGGAFGVGTLEAQNNPGATLAAGTYYYVASLLTRVGERLGTDANVTVGGSNNSVLIPVGGSPTGDYKRRVYRGQMVGEEVVYDGCWEFTGTSMLDEGQEFDYPGLIPPVIAQNDNSMIEPDANYAVQVTPNWDTTAWVTDKATTGFTINFGTAAPAGAKVDTFIYRP